jgi:hypothetical protein
VPGDYNRNGAVDAADYVVWRKSLGQTGTGLAADGNGNGEIDAGDYDLWRANFGWSSGSTANEEIPEPASWLLAALAGAAVLCIGTRRRKAADNSRRSTTDGLLPHSSTPLLHLLCVPLLVGLLTPPAHAQTLEWDRAFGAAGYEWSNGVSADGLGNVYTASFRYNDQPGSCPSPYTCFDTNAAVTKFDAAGNLLWTQLYGGSVEDEAWAVSADRLGNVFLAGDKGSDAFLAKFDPAGNLAWSRQLATPKLDYGRGVSADGLGNVYISGRTEGTLAGNTAYGTFLSKYDVDGNQQWIRQLSDYTDPNVRGGVSADELGNVFLSGNRFVAGFDASGELQWKQPIPAGNGRGVSADGLGNAYVAAYNGTEYLSKFAQDGSLEWARWVSAEVRNVYGVSADGHGNIYTTGYDSQTGSFETFLRKYDEFGNLYGTRYPGGDEKLYAHGVSADGLGSIYVAGLSHVNYDDNEFVAKFVEDPTQQPPVVIDRVAGAYQGELVVLPFLTPEGTAPITYHDLIVAGPYDASPINAPMLSSTGELLWQTTTSDVLGWYYFDVTATNAFGTDKGRIILRLQIPEPATIAMLGLAILAVGGFARRRNSGSVPNRAPASRKRSGTIARRRFAVESWFASALWCSLFLFGFSAPAAHAQTLEWVRQFGTAQGESSTSVSADGNGNVYISGFFFPAGGGFVSKYDAEGTLQWTNLETGRGGVSADSLGNVFVAADPFSKFDSEGALQWTREPVAEFVSADGLGNVYVTSWDGGPNEDAFVNKYDSAGNLQWTSRPGISERDVSQGISADALGNVYIAGFISTGSPLLPPESGSLDAFVSKFDATGDLQWTRQLATLERDLASSVAADGLGNVYVTGITDGNLGGPEEGSHHVFVAKYDVAGNRQWTTQLEAGDSRGVSADGIGNVYVTGSSHNDVFLAKLDTAGHLRSTQQLATTFRDFAYGVSADGMGHVYIAGYTYGSLGGSNAGDYDAFVAKYNDFTIPEPVTWLLAALAWAGALVVGRCWRSLRRTVVVAVLFWIGSLLLVAPAVGETITVKVPGTSNPWLAGMPAGSTAIIYDVAPAQSPVRVSGDFAQPTLSFAATGLVTNGGCGLPYCPTNGPDGGETPERPYFPHDNGAENGISDTRIPLNALVGVFLDSSQPNLTPAPGPLDFSTPASRDYFSVSPGLKQVFFIGDGLTSTGESQQVLIPAGATRLFLGTMDGCCNNDNSGSFTVHVTGIIPEPSAVFLLSVGALAVVRCGPVRIPKRRKNVSMVRNRFGCR